MFKVKKYIIVIDKMSCVHCKKKIEKLLKSMGVKKVKVNLDTKEAIVFGDIDVNLVKEKIEDLDYKVIDIKEA